MEKKILFVFLCVLSCTFVHAQTKFSVGVKGGLSIPNISASGSNKTPLSEGYSSRMAGTAGVFVEIPFSKTFSIQPEINYIGQGGKKDGLQAIPSQNYINGIMQNLPSEIAGQIPSGLFDQMPEYFYADFKSTAKFNYLMIPVLAKFGWNLKEDSPFRIYAGAGPFVSILLNAKRVSEGSSKIYVDSDGQTTVWNAIPPTGQMVIASLPNGIGDQIKNAMDGVQDMDNTQNIKDDLEPVNFGVAGIVGISCNFKRNSIFIEGGGNYGFVEIQKDGVNGKNRIGAATVTAGYAYSF